MAHPSISELLSLDNPVFRSYLFYNGVLTLKVLFMAPLTKRMRMIKKVSSSPEDISWNKGTKYGVVDSDVERVRRAHLNDLENIPMYCAAAFSYVLTNPDPTTAIMLMRLFTIARLAHTFVYAIVIIPQPARAISFIVGIGVTTFMAISSVVTFFK